MIFLLILTFIADNLSRIRPLTIVFHFTLNSTGWSLQTTFIPLCQIQTGLYHHTLTDWCIKIDHDGFSIYSVFFLQWSCTNSYHPFDFVQSRLTEKKKFLRYESTIWPYKENLHTHFSIRELANVVFFIELHWMVLNRFKSNFIQ